MLMEPMWNEWVVKSYLKNRHNANKYKSSKKHIVNGVPQGSIFGPVLLILYINDLLKTLIKSYVISFADNTNLFLSNNN